MDERQIRWTCRRGMLELDYLLLNYVDRCYTTSSKACKKLFSELLEMNDMVLYQWLIQKISPYPEKFEKLVHQILLASRIEQ